jgi:hypothetical protein
MDVHHGESRVGHLAHRSPIGLGAGLVGLPNGIQIIDKKIGQVLDLPVATADDPLLDISSGNFIDGVSIHGNTVPFFSSTSDPLQAIWRISCL